MIVTTAQFASTSNKSLHNRIVEYAKAGGIVIFGGMFSNTIRPTVFYNFSQQPGPCQGNSEITIVPRSH